MKAYQGATIEISNICNARCTWCTTGLKNRNGCTPSPEYMSAESFEKGLLYMRDNGIIDNNTELELYNWGEPFLNPEINDICGIIVKYGYSYHLSTNASVYRSIAPENLKTLSGFRVSLSGFSEETYSVTHALNYQQVMNNISKFSDMLRNAGKQGVMDISFLVYMFNVHEINDAKDYFNDMGITLTPRLAYYADFDQFQMFLKGNMPNDVKELSRKHIIEDLWRKRAQQAPDTFSCPQFNFIVLNHKWDIVPCCRLTDEDSIGNLFDMSLEDIRTARNNVYKCKDCISTKQHYVVHSPDLFKFSIDPPKALEIPKLYWDSGEGFSESQVMREGSINEESGIFYAEYTFERKPVNIRFDPVEDKYCILDELSVCTDNGMIDHYETNGFVSDGIFYFDNLDPQITFKNINSRKIIISARIHTFKNLAALHAVTRICRGAASDALAEETDDTALGKIYYDPGNGFSEEYTVTRIYNAADPHIHLEFEMPDRNITALRFDPSDFPCVIFDFKIMIGELPASVSFCNAEEINEEENGYRFESDDPVFLIDISSMDPRSKIISVDFNILPQKNSQ